MNEREQNFLNVVAAQRNQALDAAANIAADLAMAQKRIEGLEAENAKLKTSLHNPIGLP